MMFIKYFSRYCRDYHNKNQNRINRALKTIYARLDLFQKNLNFNIPISDNILNDSGYRNGQFACGLAYDFSNIFTLFHELSHAVEFLYFDNHGNIYQNLTNDFLSKIVRHRYSDSGFNFEYNQIEIFGDYYNEPTLPIGIKREIRTIVIEYILMTKFAGFKFNFDSLLNDFLTAAPYVYDFSCLNKEILDSNLLNWDISYDDYISGKVNLTQEQKQIMFSDEVRKDFLRIYGHQIYDKVLSMNNYMKTFPYLIKFWLDEVNKIK